MPSSPTSALFDMVRTAKKEKVKKPEKTGPVCEWPGCPNTARHKTVDPQATDRYKWFCKPHAAECNRSYNYFEGPATDGIDVDGNSAKVPNYGAYEHVRPRRLHKLDQRFIEEARQLGAFDKGRTGKSAKVNPTCDRRGNGADRNLYPMETRALAVLGLSAGATSADIRRKFKERAKSYHPDLNQGDRSAEDQLRKVIDAYELLKKRGLCLGETTGDV